MIHTNTAKDNTKGTLWYIYYGTFILEHVGELMVDAIY